MKVIQGRLFLQSVPTIAPPQSVDSHKCKWKTFNVTAAKLGGGGWAIGLNSRKGRIDEVGPARSEIKRAKRRGVGLEIVAKVGKGGEGAFYRKSAFYEA